MKISTITFMIVFLRLAMVGIGLCGLWCEGVPDDLRDRIVCTMFLLWYGADAIDDARRYV